MLLKETVHKTKKGLHKTLANLKCLFLQGVQKLPKTLYLIPFSCSINKTRQRRRTTDQQFYNSFYDELESCLDIARKRHIDGNINQEDDLGSEKQMPVVRSNEEVISAKEKKKKKTKGEEEEESCCSFKKNTNNRESRVLEQKMKELEMMDRSDLEQELDIEEALHYYSRLQSPLYIEIVDKFFMDMYSDFPVEEAPSVTVRNPKQASRRFRL